jgi:hypothetical protein
VASYFFFSGRKNEVSNGVPEGVVGYGTLGEVEFAWTVGGTAGKAVAHSGGTSVDLGTSLIGIFSSFKVLGSLFDMNLLSER